MASLAVGFNFHTDVDDPHCDGSPRARHGALLRTAQSGSLYRSTPSRTTWDVTSFSGWIYKTMSDLQLRTIAEIGLERLDKCSKAVGQIFFQAVRPCFTLNHLNQPMAFGSCFFLEIDQSRYLVTAAHVIDEAATTPIFINAGTELVAVAGLFSITSKPGGSRDRDRYDFAFVELSKKQCIDMKANFFITEDMISMNRTTRENRGYMALGFPEQMQLANHEARIGFTEAWTYVGFHRENRELNDALKITGEEHFSIRFESRTRSFSGVERDSIEPKGASGGILIDLGNFDPAKLHPDAPCKGLLAGILIEHHRSHDTILATDIQFVISHIRRTKTASRA